jgi:hypothetical protein
MEELRGGAEPGLRCSEISPACPVLWKPTGLPGGSLGFSLPNGSVCVDSDLASLTILGNLSQRFNQNLNKLDYWRFAVNCLNW